MKSSGKAFEWRKIEVEQWVQNGHFIHIVDNQYQKTVELIKGLQKANIEYIDFYFLNIKLPPS